MKGKYLPLIPWEKESETETEGERIKEKRRKEKKRKRNIGYYILPLTPKGSKRTLLGPIKKCTAVSESGKVRTQTKQRQHDLYHPRVQWRIKPWSCLDYVLHCC